MAPPHPKPHPKLHYKPSPKLHPKPQTDFYISGRRYAISSAGVVRQLIVTFHVMERKGSLSWYYIWFQDVYYMNDTKTHDLVQTHAINYAILHDLREEKTVFGKEHVYSFPYYVPAGMRVNEFAPDYNRTQIGIARREADWFLVRFIIEFNKSDRHMFMVKFTGKAPQSFLGKPYWGTTYAAGDTPGSVDYIVW